MSKLLFIVFALCLSMISHSSFARKNCDKSGACGPNAAGECCSNSGSGTWGTSSQAVQDAGGGACSCKMGSLVVPEGGKFSPYSKLPKRKLSNE